MLRSQPALCAAACQGYVAKAGGKNLEAHATAALVGVIGAYSFPVRPCLAQWHSPALSWKSKRYYDLRKPRKKTRRVSISGAAVRRDSRAKVEPDEIARLLRS
jgi:hypothetical protein